MASIKGFLYLVFVLLLIGLLVGSSIALGMRIGRYQERGELEQALPNSFSFFLDLFDSSDEEYNESIGIELLAEKCSREPDIEAKSRCLHGFVVPIFKYKVRNETEDISYQTLFKEGGDCGSWADFYVKVADMMGVDSQRIVIGVNNETSHAFAVLNNHQGYCVLDQTHINCFTYGEDYQNETG